ncbi:MAG: hypothetical protein OHK0052_22010 [Anaerolineales bacterium]
MRRNLRGLLGALLLAVILSACGAADSPEPTPAPSRVAALPTSTRAPTKPPSATPTERRAPTVTAIPSPTAIPWAVCSPLAEHSLADLPNIVASAYNPPPMGRDERHQGVDFAYYWYGGRESIIGMGVNAALPGRVALAQANRVPYGNTVIIETPLTLLDPRWLEGLNPQPGDSLYTLYAHLRDLPLVQPGELVTCGQPLGVVGDTGGEATGFEIVHLHFEMRFGPANQSFERMVFYDTRATAQEMETYRRWRMSGEFRHFDPMVLVLQALSIEP